MKKTTSFVELVKEIDIEYRTQRDRGTLFELLTISYFENEPMYERLFEKVWKLSDVPEEYNIPKKDTGVDLVAKKRDTGELVAIQCKYYSEDTVIRKAHIDSFLNEVGKSYYSEGIIVTTTNNWSSNAEDALRFRNKAIARISLMDLQESKIDWSAYSFNNPKKVILQDKKTPRPHQIPAIEAVVNGFKNTDRGKLIMAPGTGKTYTSMAIAEKMAAEKNGVFRVLYLVPSIQLLSQTLRGWNADISYSMDSIAVCSDRKVTKAQGENELEDIAAADLGYPATTNHVRLLEYQKQIDTREEQGEILTVFSTYQSIDVVIEAQRNGFYEFDLVICDEAHRTTGATELGKEGSSFTKVHYNTNIKAAKRLYQTATPRVYGESARQKADEMSVLIADMSDTELYGEEFYRIGFGQAIRQGILTDYKVMVLAVDEEMIARRFQQMLSKDSELEFDDVTKIIGCWNGLVRRRSNSDEALGAPMKRAIAFTGTIRESKLITNMFSHVVDQYLYQDLKDYEKQYNIEIDHADGSMNALEKNKRISWLKEDVPENTCRILSNARFLTEGVDVPDLDAVMFLKPRKSKIDIAQAVGRVMRKVEGKDYGYIILPIGIAAGTDAKNVLDNNEKYRVVWEVLNALRSIDERFDATINKLELNKKKPDQVQVVGVGDAPEGGELDPVSHQLALELNEEDLTDIERAIFGKIVRKVGNVRYWEDWSKDVAEIARKHMMRIQVMLEDEKSEAYSEFEKFVLSLRHNINGSITNNQAIEMLAQHLITKPVFEALFESYSFVNNNPVSKAMDSILRVLEAQGLIKEQERLEDFYESVRIRAEGIDNLKAKQEIIIQLYNKFFKVGFKETTERLGIVFTPVEVVDFIINSVDYILEKEFGKSLSNKGIHVLDPFTGTGTFITRLLQSGLISKEDLLRKYTQEIHANEMILLSYYIAAINIEETFHSLSGGDYKPFEGIVLTDTFESTESKDSLVSELFDENNERIKKQQDSPIFVIVGNPPYSSKQKSNNDNLHNFKYPALDESIEKTYVAHSTATNKQVLYDSYARAFRWSTDRIGENGVVAFVSNGSFIDGAATDGIRNSLYKEFNDIYIINLRGNARTQGEIRKKEGGGIFGEGSRTTIAIVILVKNSSKNSNTIHYKEIDDYLTREQKLNEISSWQSIKNLDFSTIIPNEYSDWINQRITGKSSPSVLIGSKKSKENNVFLNYSGGIKTGRDAWSYNFSSKKLMKNINTLINNYNEGLEKGLAQELLSSPTKIKWTRGLITRYSKKRRLDFIEDRLYTCLYRPFTKKNLYFEASLLDMQYMMPKIFPTPTSRNKVILVPGKAGTKEFSCLVTDVVSDLNLFTGGSQAFPYLIYNESNDSLFDSNAMPAISIEYKKSWQEKYNVHMSNQEIFSYLYGVLHSKDYIATNKNELIKGLPSIPYAKNYKKFVEIGNRLIDLHLNYESVEPYKSVEVIHKPNPSFKVHKMKHPNKNKLDTVIFNNDITINNIPEKAYEYVVNGRSIIHWIIEQYQVRQDTDSGIVDDPNDYSNDEKYVFNLLLRAINVAVQTVDLVNSLPPLEVEELD
ncbi:DEAD/DEAH box helicase [Edaphobacillus lindanitolerans]|uniref:Predicted helicase n=1 Tax=Edaphobacillus lindanitolerans TaxID=550447 RepID=A0A1U7PPG4_9BACI|nr:type ISP restriction/modification enzyme [Edaphobacillus lindanitolerans]SIT90653.1 Predicted helicase [Edaphobacillus lindanitolerans]